MLERLAGVALLLALAGPAAAADRVRLVLNGVWSAAPPGFSDTRTITEFAESGSFSASYRARAAVGPDLGVQVTLLRRLGAFLAVSSAARAETGSFQAGLPHPLYLNRHRNVAGELSGYRLEETAVHLDLAFGAALGSLDYALFAGATLFAVEADLVDAVRYDHSYPYDTVSLGAVPGRRMKDSPAGFNVGGRLDYRFGSARRFGLGVLVRYSGAKARLKPTDASAVEVDAGGLTAGGGVRLYF